MATPVLNTGSDLSRLYRPAGSDRWEGFQPFPFAPQWADPPARIPIPIFLTENGIRKRTAATA